jgi:hypothetical protein
MGVFLRSDRVRQDLRDVYAVLDVLIADKDQFGGIADDHALAERAADIPLRVLQRVHQGVPPVILQYADIDLRVPQVTGHLSPRHGPGAAHPGILDLLPDDGVHFPPDFLRNSVDSLVTHVSAGSPP